MNLIHSYYALFQTVKIIHSIVQIFQHLQKQIGKSTPTPVKGLSCTILRFRQNSSDHGHYDDEIMAEHYGKLCIALDVLHECFVTIIEPRTQSDISEDIVFNRE